MPTARFSALRATWLDSAASVTGLERYKNSKGEIWLNIASSSSVLGEFVNLDNHVFLTVVGIYPLVKTAAPKKYRPQIENYRKATTRACVIRHDCRKPIPFPDTSVDHILCSHFLEHVYPKEMKAILRDFHRLLKKHATLHVIVPDLAALVARYLDAKGSPAAADNFVDGTILSRKERGSFKYRIMECLGGYGLQHRWMYDEASLSARLVDAGFEILERNETPSRKYRLDDGSVHVIGRKI